MNFRKNKYPLTKMAKWLWSYHKGCRKQALTNIVLGLLQIALSLTGVEVLKNLTDTATSPDKGPLWNYVILLAILLIAEIITGLSISWTRGILGVRSQNNMQRLFFTKILNSKWAGNEKFHSGDILNRLYGDVYDIVNLMTEAIPSVFVVTVQFVASIIYLHSMNSTLAYILITVSPVFILLSKLYFRRMRKIVRRIKDSNSHIQALMQESIQHRMVIKTLEQDGSILNSLGRRQKLLCNQVAKRTRFSVVSRTMLNFGFAGGYMIALIWGIYGLRNGDTSIGILLAFTQLVGKIQRPMLDFIRLVPTFVGSATSCERLMELDELEPEKEGEKISVQMPAGIRFTDVTCRYTDDGRTILENFNHDFRPGTFTAIFGETGAGKTTLIRMMLALLTPQHGKVEIYGNDGTSYAVAPSTRCNFSYVPQGNTLFSGTIRDNMRMGRHDATDAQIIEALHNACADFVMELPDGLDTVCGEHGYGLSEGQAQRIAVARALLRPGGILLLDEATSALDEKTEATMLNRIKEIYKGKTIIFVTHRTAIKDLSTDKLVLERRKMSLDDL